jgi:hypothetical protein
MDKTSFEIGTQASFIYHGKERDGIVEVVADTFVTLKLAPSGWQNTGNVEDQPTHKTFSYYKIGK